LGDLLPLVDSGDHESGLFLICDMVLDDRCGSFFLIRDDLCCIDNYFLDVLCGYWANCVVYEVDRLRLKKQWINSIGH